MTLRLHLAAHHTKANEGLPLPCDKSRNDGVERALVRRVAVWLALLQIKQSAAILERKPKPFRADTRTKPEIKALDQRHHVSVLVGRGKVNRVAVVQERIARVITFRGVLWINEFSPRGGVILRD